MRTTPYAELLSHAASLCGLSDPSSADLQGNTSLALHRHLQRRLKTVWEMAWWPETMRSQLRYYRAAYNNSTTYASGAEVYYATTGLYYIAVAPTTGIVPTNTAYWSAVDSDFDPYVSLTQTGEDEIGKLHTVATESPLSVVTPRRLPWQLSVNGIQIFGDTVPSSVYVYFQTVAPILKGDTFSASSVYAAGATVYYASDTVGYEGDYYTCLATTTAAQSPETTAAKWAKQAIPERLRDSLAHYVCADYLRASGARELAPAEEGAADLALARAMQSANLTNYTAPRFRAA